MFSTTHKQPHFDDLARDASAGVYHCPKCQAPFTRRSNLRRHYAIHTRSMPFKCTVCGQEFSHSDEFHLHILTCAEEARNGPPEYLSQAITRLQSNICTTSGDLTPPPLLEAILTPPPISQVLQETSMSEIDQTLRWSMPSCTSSTSPSLIPSLYYANSESTQGGMFSSMSSDIGQAPDGRRHQFEVRPGPRRDPNHYNASPRRTKDGPVYTKRQVDDMLGALSNCFAQTLQNIIRQSRDGDALSPVVHPDLAEAVPNRSMGIVVAHDMHEAYPDVMYSRDVHITHDV